MQAINKTFLRKQQFFSHNFPNAFDPRLFKCSGAGYHI